MLHSDVFGNTNRRRHLGFNIRLHNRSCDILFEYETMVPNVNSICCLRVECETTAPSLNMRWGLLFHDNRAYIVAVSELINGSCFHYSSLPMATVTRTWNLKPKQPAFFRSLGSHFAIKTHQIFRTSKEKPQSHIDIKYPTFHKSVFSKDLETWTMVFA